MGYLKTQSGVVKQTLPQESAKAKIKGAYCHTDDMEEVARVYEGGASLFTSRRGGDTERSLTDPFESMRTLAGRRGWFATDWCAWYDVVPAAKVSSSVVCGSGLLPHVLASISM